MEIVRFIIHYGMHFIVPFAISFFFFKDKFWKVSLIILLANLIDLDHLLANPIFDPNRNSIGLHMLHSYFSISVYFILLLFPKTRLLAIGLLLHILTDYIDSLWIF